MSAAQLSEYIERAAEREFEWNRRNCAHFVAAWVQEREGADLLGKVADGVVDKMGAARRIIALGGLGSAVTTLMARPPIPVAYAQVGDIVCVFGEGGNHLGLCCGRTAAFLAEGKGIVHVDIGQALMAWPVGRKA